MLPRRYAAVLVTLSRYDVTPDGNTFLLVGLPGGRATTLSIILNWDVEVREKLATSRRSQPDVPPRAGGDPALAIIRATDEPDGRTTRRRL